MSSMETILFEGTGVLYSCPDPKEYHFEPLIDEEEEVCVLCLVCATTERGSAAAYYLTVQQGTEEVLRQTLNANNNVEFDLNTFSVQWYAVIEGELNLLSFKFSGSGGRSAARSSSDGSAALQWFINVYNRCIYALLTHNPVVDVDEKDEWFRYLSGMAARPQTSAQALSDGPIYEFSDDSTTTSHTSGLPVANQCSVKEGRNVCFQDAVSFHRTLVVKRPENNSDDSEGMFLQSHAFGERGYDPARTEMVFVPRAEATTQSSLLDHAQHQLYMFGNRENKIQEVDLEHGTIVQEYTPENMSRASVPITKVVHANQNPLEHHSILTVLSNKVAFNIDTRADPKNCVVLEAGKTIADYALSSLKGNFTCHSTSANGHLAIGDSTGNLRLYSGPPGSRREDPLKSGSEYFPKTAKTLLQLQQPILFVDISSDGRFILATLDKFILFINTVFTDDKSHEKLGFTDRMGAQKPSPLRLQPSATLIFEMGGAERLHFKEARFSNYDDAGNSGYIVASCGDYLLSWTLSAVVEAEQLQNMGTLEQTGVARISKQVLSSGSTVPDRVTFLTNDEVGLLPLRKTAPPPKKYGEWTWGKKK